MALTALRLVVVYCNPFRLSHFYALTNLFIFSLSAGGEGNTEGVVGFFPLPVFPFIKSLP
jgi:hypothetical protein